MKTYENHKPSFKFNNMIIELKQISEKEIKELYEKYSLEGLPIFFAYVEKHPDGSDCDIPLYMTYPQFKGVTATRFADVVTMQS